MALEELAYACDDSRCVDTELKRLLLDTDECFYPILFSYLFLHATNPRTYY